MRLSIGERQRGTPGAAEQLPSLDVEMVAQPLHVGDQVPGGVPLQAGVRDRAPATALVEQDNAIASGLMIAAHAGVTAPTGAAMDDDHRLAARVAAFLEKNLVLRIDLEMLLAIGLDGGIKAEPLTCQHHWSFPLSL
jgi:hypothetical protein